MVVGRHLGYNCWPVALSLAEAVDNSSPLGLWRVVKLDSPGPFFGIPYWT